MPRPKITDLFFDRLPKITLFMAPAGYGKTNAMNACRDRLGQRAIQSGWLTLDESHNDPVNLGAALMKVIGGLQCPVSQDDDRHPAYHSEAEIMAGLFDAERRIERRSVLFLDNLEILGPASIRVIKALLSGGKSHLHYVIGTRQYPRINKVAHILREELLEFGKDDLRFHSAEIASLVAGCMLPPLSDEQMQTLLDRTEGWPTAIHLVCLNLQNNTKSNLDRLFARVEDDLEDYLAEEVFLQQPKELQEFMVETACLGSFTSDLARAVTGREDSKALLRSLEEQGSFISSVADNGAGMKFSYHQIFARFLTRRLRQNSPQRYAAIVENAVEFLVGQRMYTEAADLALKRNLRDTACAIYSEVAMGYMTEGRFQTVIRWVETVSIEHAWRYPRLFMAYIWAVIYSERPSDAASLIRQARDEQERFAADIPNVEDILSAAQVIAAARLDDMALVREMGPRVMSGWKAEDGFHYGALAITTAHAFVYSGDWEQAFEYLEKSEPSLSNDGKLFGRVSFQLIGGISKLAAARNCEAIAELQYGYQAVCAGRGKFSHGAAILAGVLANALYEQNSIDDARKLIGAHLPLISENGLPDAVACSYVTAIRLALLSGDEVEACRLIRQGEVKIGARGLHRVVGTILWEAARMASLSGSFEEAARIERKAAGIAAAHKFPATSWLPNDLPPLWLALWRGETEGLLDRIECLREADAGRKSRLRTMQLDFLYGCVLDRAGRSAEARRHAARAMLVGLGGGMVRFFLDHGPDAARLVRESQDDLLAIVPPGQATPVERWLAVLRPHILEAGKASPLAPATDAWGALMEPLTQRELEILDCLQHGLTNKELAASLALSETTVKWHLRNIFGKLQVDNRTEAVAVARTAGCFAAPG